MRTAHINHEILAAHGRLRLLRKLRNLEAEKLRKTVERMNGALLASLRSLDLNGHNPLGDGFNDDLASLRNIETVIAEIDAERSDVAMQIAELETE